LVPAPLRNMVSATGCQLSYIGTRITAGNRLEMRSCGRSQDAHLSTTRIQEVRLFQLNKRKRAIGYHLSGKFSVPLLNSF